MIVEVVQENVLIIESKSMAQTVQSYTKMLFSSLLFSSPWPVMQRQFLFLLNSLAVLTVMCKITQFYSLWNVLMCIFFLWF